MTRDEAVNLARDIDNSISREGIAHGSGYFVVCKETVDEIDYVGLVDVSVQRDDETGEEEYNVYSIACEDGGEDICEPEWDAVRASISALADFLLKLANVTFRRSEIERLASA